MEAGAIGTEPKCVRCGRVISRNAERAEVFEGMHWSCFHFEFEHGNSGDSDDPDIACGDPECPARAHDRSARPTWFEETDPGKRPWQAG